MCQITTIPVQPLGLSTNDPAGGSSIIDPQPQEFQQRRTSLSNQAQSNDERRRIQFATHQEIYEIPHLDDICDEEYEETWFSSDEIDDMVREAKMLAAKIDKGCIISGLCTRGLEQNTKTHRKKLLAVAELKYEAISSIQDSQKYAQLQNMFISVEDVIADICKRCSSEVVAHAIEVAKKDATEARIAHCC